MSWLIRFLLFVVLFLVLRSLVGRLFARRQESPREPAFRRRAEMRSVGTETVKDPVCGTYVEKSLAIPLESVGGAIFHFCSEECKTKYLSEHPSPRS